MVSGRTACYVEPTSSEGLNRIEVPVDTTSEVLTMLNDYYASESASPLSMAMLGKWMSERRLERPAGLTLSEWAANELKAGYVIVTDPLVAARRALVPRGREPEVLEAWAAKAELAPGDSLLSSLPRQLLVAFHIVPRSTDERVFVRLRPAPVRYQVSEERPVGDSWFEVGAAYRPAKHTYFGSVEHLGPEVRESLEQRVRSWMKDVGLEEKDITRRPRQHAHTCPDVVTPPSTALERLVLAQPPAMRKHLMVPGDIAAILLKYE